MPISRRLVQKIAKSRRSRINDYEFFAYCDRSPFMP